MFMRTTTVCFSVDLVRAGIELGAAADPLERRRTPEVH